VRKYDLYIFLSLVMQQTFQIVPLSYKQCNIAELNCFRGVDPAQKWRTLHRCGPLVCFSQFSVSTPVRSAHTCMRVYLCRCYSSLVVCHTAVSLPGAGTVYSDILGLIVLNVNVTKQTNRIRDLKEVQGLLRILSMIPLELLT
jgi:hypothetical protein